MPGESLSLLVARTASSHTVGSGQNIVLLPGWGFKSSIWNDLAATLAGHFRVTCIDLPGHGDAPAIASERASAASYAAAVAGNAPRRALWLGWSLGGMIAMQVAMRYPQRVSGLILIATTPRFTSSRNWPWAIPDTVLADFRADLAVDPHRTLVRFLHLQLQHSEHAAQSARVMRRHLSTAGKASTAGLAAGLEVLRTTDLTSQLSVIDCPALTLFGKKDPLVPANVGHYLSRNMAQVELHTIANAGHAPFISHGMQFKQSLQKFLAHYHA